MISATAERRNATRATIQVAYAPPAKLDLVPFAVGAEEAWCRVGLLATVLGVAKKRDRGRSTLGGPSALVLYRTPECWRFSLCCPGGIACGALDDDPDPGCEPEVAQAAMKQRAEQITEHILEIVWRPSDRPDWWTGEVTKAALPAI